MSDFFDDTAEFLEVGGHLEGTAAERRADPANRELRVKLLREEFEEEYLKAEEADDWVEIADGLVDTIVIATGTLFSYFGVRTGMRCLATVAASNLSKFVLTAGRLRPILRADGKIMKGPNYKAPDIEGILREDGHIQ